MSPMLPMNPVAEPSDDVVMGKNRNRAGSAGSFLRGMIQTNLGGEAVAPVESQPTASFPAKFANKVALTASSNRLKADSYDSDGIEDDRRTASTRPESSAWGGSGARDRTASIGLKHQSSAGASGFVKGILSRVTSGIPSSSGDGSASSSAGGRQQYSPAAERALSTDDDDEEEDHLLDRHHPRAATAAMEEDDDYERENLNYATSSSRELDAPFSRPTTHTRAFGYGGGRGIGGSFEDFKPIVGNDGTLNMPGAASPPPFGHPAWAMQQQARNGSNILSAATLSAEERIWVGIEGLLADAFSTSGGSRRTLTTDFGEYDDDDDEDEDDLYRKDGPEQGSIHIDTSRVNLEPPDVLRQLSREVQERNVLWQQQQQRGTPQAGAGQSAPTRNNFDDGEDISRTDELLNHMSRKRDPTKGQKNRNDREDEDDDRDDRKDWNEESTTASSASSDDVDDDLDEIEMAQVALDSFMEFLLPEMAQRAKSDAGGDEEREGGGGKRELLRRQLEALSGRNISKKAGEADERRKRKKQSKFRRGDSSAPCSDDEDDSVDDAELAHTALNSFMDVLLSGVEQPPEQTTAAISPTKKRFTGNTSSTIQSSSTSSSSSVSTSGGSSSVSSHHKPSPSKQRRSSFLSVESPTLESKKSLLTGDRLTLFELFRWSLRVNVDEQFAGNTKKKLAEALNVGGRKNKKNRSTDADEDPHQTPVAGPKTTVTTVLRGGGDEEGIEIEPYKPQEDEKETNPRIGIAAPPLLSAEQMASPAVGGGDTSAMPFFSNFALTDVGAVNNTPTDELTSFFHQPQLPPPDPQQMRGNTDSDSSNLVSAEQALSAPDHRQQQMQVAATFTSTRRNDLRRAMSNLETIYDEDEHEDTEEDDDDDKKLSPEEKNAKKKRRSPTAEKAPSGDIAAKNGSYIDTSLHIPGASVSVPSDEGSRAVGGGHNPKRNRGDYDNDDDIAVEEDDDIRKVIRDLKEIGAMFGIDKMELESTTMSDLSAEDAAAAVKDFASHPEKLQRYKQEMVARRASIEEPRDRRRLTSYRQPRDSQELALLQAAGITPRSTTEADAPDYAHDLLGPSAIDDDDDVIGRKRTNSDEASFTRFLEVVQSIYTGKNLDEDDLLAADYHGKGQTSKRRGEEKAEETMPETAVNAPLTTTVIDSRDVAEAAGDEDISSTLRLPGSVRTLPRPPGTEAPPNEEAKILMSERLNKSSLDSAAAANYSGWRHSLVLSSLTQSGADEVASSYAGPMYHSTSNPRFSQQGSQRRLPSNSAVVSLPPSREVDGGQAPASPATGKPDSSPGDGANALVGASTPGQSNDVQPSSEASETMRNKKKTGDSIKSLSPTPSTSSLRQKRSSGKLKPYNNSNREGDTSTPTSQDSQPPRIMPMNKESMDQAEQQGDPQLTSNRDSIATVTSFFGTNEGGAMEFDNSWFEKNFRESVSASAPGETQGPAATKEAAAAAIAEAKEQGLHSSIQGYDSGYFDSNFASNRASATNLPKRDSTSSTAFTSQGSSTGGDDNNMNFMPTVSLPPIQEFTPSQDLADIQAEARHRDAQRAAMKRNNKKKKSFMASFREGWCRCVVNPLFRRPRGPLEDDDDSVALAAKAAGGHSRRDLLAINSSGGGYDRNEINDLYLTSSSSMDQNAFRPLGLQQ